MQMPYLTLVAVLLCSLMVPLALAGTRLPVVQTLELGVSATRRTFSDSRRTGASDASRRHARHDAPSAVVEQPPPLPHAPRGQTQPTALRKAASSSSTRSPILGSHESHALGGARPGDSHAACCDRS